MNSGALRDCLRRLLSHVDEERIALTGGVAIGIHVARHTGLLERAAAAEDIDFVADGLDAIRPSVTNCFLVSHFHLPQQGYSKFLVQLVDPITRLRVDFFPDALGALDRAPVADIAGTPIRMLAAGDILEHKVRILSTGSAEDPVEDKHYRDAIRLTAMCGRDMQPMASSHLVGTAKSKDCDAPCPKCDRSQCPDFPLASKQEILEILGYV